MAHLPVFRSDSALRSPPVYSSPQPLRFSAGEHGSGSQYSRASDVLMRPPVLGGSTGSQYASVGVAVAPRESEPDLYKTTPTVLTRSPHASRVLPATRGKPRTHAPVSTVRSADTLIREPSWLTLPKATDDAHDVDHQHAPEAKGTGVRIVDHPNDDGTGDPATVTFSDPHQDRTSVRSAGPDAAGDARPPTTLNPFEDNDYITTPADNRGFMTPPPSVPAESARRSRTSPTVHPAQRQMSRTSSPLELHSSSQEVGGAHYNTPYNLDLAPLDPVRSRGHSPVESSGAVVSQLSAEPEVRAMVKTDDGPPRAAPGGHGSPEQRDMRRGAPPPLEYHPRHHEHAAALPPDPPLYPPVRENPYSPLPLEHAGYPAAAPQHDQGVQTSASLFDSPPRELADAGQQTTDLHPGVYSRQPPSEPEHRSATPHSLRSPSVILSPSERVKRGHVVQAPPSDVYDTATAFSRPESGSARRGETPAWPESVSQGASGAEASPSPSHVSRGEGSPARLESAGGRVGSSSPHGSHRTGEGYTAALPPPTRAEVQDITERLRAGNLLSGRPLAGSPHRVRPRQPDSPQREPVSISLPRPPRQVVDDVADLLRRANVLTSPEGRRRT